MKKHIIRILTVLCMFCLGAALFVGCKPQEEKPDDKPTTYTVTYAANGGTGTAPAVEKYKEGETFKVKENPFTKEGSTFKTWNDGSKDYAPGATYTMPKKNVTFTAQWTGGETKEQVTVTFSLGENTTGKAPDAQKVNKGEEYTLPAAPAWAGHTFKGWKVGNDATLKQVGDKITPTADVTVTAQWEVQKEQVTVTFALGEHSDGTALDPVQTNKGEEYTLPAGPAAAKADNFNAGQWTGYVFDGWKIGETDDVKKAGEKITPSANVTLTAQWKEVHFEISGASLEATDSVMYVVVTGLYTGFTDEEFIAAQEDANDHAVYISVSLGTSPWTAQKVDSTTEAEDGEFSVKLDVTALEKGVPYSVLADGSGYGDIRTITVEESKDLGEKKYSLKAGNGSGLILTIGEAGKSYAFTAMKVEAESDKVYFTVSGTYSGYAADEIKGLFEDEDKGAQYVGITATAAADGLGAWKWPECAMTVTAADGQFTIKLDVTDVPIVLYYVCENNSGSGDIAWNDAFASTVTANGKKYTIEKNGYGNTQLNVEEYIEAPKDATYAVTALTIEKQADDKVYLVYKGTCANYEQATLEATLKKALCLDVHKIGGGATGTNGWTFTMSDGTWEMKLNITVGGDNALFTAGTYFIDTLNDYSGAPADAYFKLWNTDVSVEFGDYRYKISAPIGKSQSDPIYTWGNVAFVIESADTPAYTFSKPTSAKIEVTADKGNGTDENFTNNIDKAFFVISGTYTGEATEKDAKDFFAFAKYPFAFGDYNSTKDRIRRISIDTSAHTYTVKLDVSWLPEGELICRFNATDALKLDKTACPDGTVKAVGSTYTLTNYAGQDQHEGGIVLKVERNYEVTGVEVKEEGGKATLVVNGTFDNAFTAEQIKKFLEDEDVRSMCIDLYGNGGWQKVTTVVTTEAGKFTVKVDLSALANATYNVCPESNGYGEITTLTASSTVTVGNKTYTVSGAQGSTLTLTVADKAA